MGTIFNSFFHFLKKYRVSLVLCVSLLFYIASMILTKFDTLFHFEWITFWLHISSILIILGFFSINIVKKQYLQKINFLDVFIFGIILVLAEAINLLFLQAYPFVSLGDEVRDGGLDAMNIVHGTITNIFSYGRYEAHGLIIPTITSFFYHIFQSSVLTYRFPSALLACFDVIILYFLLRLVINKTAAFWGAFALLVLPLHLFFARTEIVVMFSSFWTSVMLLALYLLLRQKKSINYAMLGILLGFASTFHVSARTVASLILLGIVAIDVFTISKRFLLYKTIKGRIGKLFLLLIFCVVGFGPQLFFTTPQIFLHESEFTFKDDLSNQHDMTSLITMENFKLIKKNYLKSVVVWFYEPITSRYPNPISILPPFLTIFFLLGIGYSFFILRNNFLYFMLYLALAIPFTNSAITSWINAAHRLLPLVPIGAFFIGIGVWFIVKNIKYFILQGVVAIVIASYLLYQVYSFFFYLPANDNKTLSEYVSMHIINVLQTNPNYVRLTQPQAATPPIICVAVSPATYQSFVSDQIYEEQWQYFLNPYSVEKISDPTISDNEAYIFKSHCPTSIIAQNTNAQVTSCHTRDKNFYCPNGYNGNITIHY